MFETMLFWYCIVSLISGVVLGALIFLDERSEKREFLAQLMEKSKQRGGRVVTVASREAALSASGASVASTSSADISASATSVSASDVAKNNLVNEDVTDTTDPVIAADKSSAQAA